MAAVEVRNFKSGNPGNNSLQYARRIVRQKDVPDLQAQIMSFDTR